MGCGAQDEQSSAPSKDASGENSSTSLIQRANEPTPPQESSAAIAPLALVLNYEAGAAPNVAGVCEAVLSMANAQRARGELFFEIAAASGDIGAPAWSSMDSSANARLIAQGLYDGWCEAPARVNPSNGKAFSKEDVAACRQGRMAEINELLRGETRLEKAAIDINRDGVEETIYQFHADPAMAGRSGEEWLLWNLQPRIFFSAVENDELHKQLHATTFAPEASIFLRDDKIFALRAWNGDPDRFEIFWIRPTLGRIGEIPLCQMTAERTGDVQ